jgi:hypothetical protein
MAAVPEEHQTRLAEVSIWLVDHVEMEGELISWATHGDVTERSDTAKRRELAESLFNKLISGSIDGLTAEEFELLEGGFRSRIDLLGARITQADASLNPFKHRSRVQAATEAYSATRAARDWLKENRPEPRPVLESLGTAPVPAAATTVDAASLDR